MRQRTPRNDRVTGSTATGHPDWRYTLDDFKSDDESMATCLGLARIAARTDLPILILGETGTGKTMLARAIHNSSRRAPAPFVAFNSSALSDTLLDSQLFGHEKGAFTGAIKRVKGKFEQADRGTLFLDEIADMSSAGQAKILRAVEYGEFERLGGRDPAGGRRAPHQRHPPSHGPLPRHRSLPEGPLLPDQRHHPAAAAPQRAAEGPSHHHGRGHRRGRAARRTSRSSA